MKAFLSKVNQHTKSLGTGCFLLCTLALGAASCLGQIGEFGSPAGGRSGGISNGPNAAPEGKSDVGRVAIHRLNNKEYDNTMRDLLGVTSAPGKTFVDDEQAYGFDNIADAFGMTNARFEQYFTAADSLVEEAFASATLRNKIVTCTPSSESDTACIQRTINSFGARAWRRPLVAAETASLLKVATDAIGLGEDATGGLKQAVKAMLTSAKFLYRIEFDANPTSAEPHRLDAYEQASRLSYLLWSTMPDAQLFAAAQSGELLTDEGLSAQFDRLIADPKATAFIVNFAGQWLGVRNLISHQVEPTVFPEFNDTLRQSMMEEGFRFFAEFLYGKRPMTEFFTVDMNFVDRPLNAIYKFNGVTGTDRQRVSVTTDQRLGFLGLAGFLTMTSFSYRTAPTLRGKWVLENLLCQEIPPPPSNVPELDKTGAMDHEAQIQNVRARLEAHRVNPSCAACHNILDPIGMGLENFDAIGRYRTSYANGDAVDSSGMLPNASSFKSLPELAKLLSQDPRLTDCAAKKLMVYSLSRGLTDSDVPYLKQIREKWTAQGLNLHALLKNIVLSDPFRFRRGEP